MKKIKSIDKTTNNRFLNMYDFHTSTRSGKPMTYFVSSRAEKQEELKINKGIDTIDAAIIFAVMDKEDEDYLVVIRQYRYAIDDYIYEIPAGLIDANETLESAAIREMKEETGLDFTPVSVPDYLKKGFYTSVGLSDETCATVYGYASGEISKDNLEDSEDIEVLIINRNQAKDILSSGIVALPCGYMLMHYIASEKHHALDFCKQK